MEFTENSRFKILISLFSKKIKKSFRVFVFDEYAKKVSFDAMIFGYKSNNFGKKNKLSDSFIFNAKPLIESYTSIKNKPITLTYYLKEEK